LALVGAGRRASTEAVSGTGAGTRRFGIERAVIDRASATDLAFLAMDTGPVPQQIGAVLVLGAGAEFDVSRAEELIAQRVSAVPRLRQRLVRVPPGCGRAIWVDDADFDVRRHVREVRCRYPGDQQALLDLAAAVVIEPLPRSRPLWSAVFITGLADNAVALVIVVHHVLVDGIGGLAVLANLVDHRIGPASLPTVAFPRRPPSARRLAVDAVRWRLRAVLRVPAAWHRLRVSMAAGGGLAPARAAPCSLVQPTGPRRRFAVVRTDLANLRAAAHRHHGTVNDAVLTAIAGALCRVLVSRGESIDTIAIAVPVAGRRSATASELGNQVGPMLVTVPGAGTPSERIRQVAATVRARKDSAAGPPPIAVLGTLFRVAAALGAYHWYINHQRRMHTLVSHVRGPEQPITFADAPIKAIIPAAVGEAGNITVSFEVLSYAGTVTITAIADPDRFPDLSTLTDALQVELALLTHETADSNGPANGRPVTSAPGAHARPSQGPPAVGQPADAGPVPAVEVGDGQRDEGGHARDVAGDLGRDGVYTPTVAFPVAGDSRTRRAGAAALRTSPPLPSRRPG
jgi:WS/DGAT/MGAT family acyltransferase